jgi:toxin ParE1/3/4
MRKILLSPLAERDLIGIWQYSIGQWGEAQADQYLDDLDDAIKRLSNNPASGASRDHVRQGYRVLFIKSHAIYYKVTSTAIHIVRVLHVRMDADTHL